MVEPLRHRQTKEAETDMFSLQPPRHIPTLPRLCEKSVVQVACRISVSISAMRKPVALATSVGRRHLRKQFCASLAHATFHTAWTHCGPRVLVCIVPQCRNISDTSRCLYATTMRPFATSSKS